jgi:glycosyltransferase involved in cell wall biosynthesis
LARQLRVVIAGPYPRAEGVRIGGVEAYSDYLSSGLVARGDMDVHVLTAVEHLTSARQRRTSTGVTVHEVPLIPRYQFVVDYLINIPRMHAVLTEINPDIVHVQTQKLYPAAALERGFPSLLTVHGMGFLEARLAKNARQQFRGLYASLAERSTLRRARHVICLNSYALNTMRPYIRTKDVRIIDNAVDDRFFDLEDRAEPGRVLFAGLILDRKNVMGLLEAAKIIVKTFPGLRLRLAGRRVDEDYYQQCLSYVQNNGLSGNVEFLDNVDADGIAAELASANLMVLPAKQETSPMIISETMAAGKPIVATPVGGIPEVVVDGETGFLAPVGDPQGLADKILRLLTDSALRQRMGAAARAVAAGRFKRSVNIDRTLAFYDEILKDEGKTC